MSCGYVRTWAQTSSPVTASNATTRPLPSETYMSPFATIGVATQRLLSRIVYAQTGRKLVDVAAVDLSQRAERRHVVGAAIAEPVAGLGLAQPLGA